MRFKTFRIDLTGCNQVNYYGKGYARNLVKPISRRDRFLISHKNCTQTGKLRKVRGDRFNSPQMRYSNCHRVRRYQADEKVI